jgi:hypothetical protein
MDLIQPNLPAKAAEKILFIGNRRGKEDMWGLFAGVARKQSPHIAPTTADPKEPKILPARVGKLQDWMRTLAWHLAVPLAFTLIVLFFFPSRGRFEFSTDEGINLMKSMLVSLGYPLYGEIWSDQPPLFTYLLSAAFYFFGFKVGVGRMLVLILSSMLMWAAFQFMILVWGRKQALAGALLLFLTPKYMTLSVSVMVGLPALAFAMVSLLFLTLWHQRRQPVFIVLSGILLGLSILTKLITGFLAPIFLLGLLISEYSHWRGGGSWRKVLFPAFLWGAVFGVVSATLLVLLVGIEFLPQIIDTHLAATAVEDLRENYFTINVHLQSAWPVLFLALVGAAISLRSRAWLALYPIAWALTAYVLLYNHRPVWIHHQLLVTVPAALLGGAALYEGASWFLQVIRPHVDKSAGSLVRVAALAGMIALLFSFRVHEPISLLSPTPSLSVSGFELGPLVERFFLRMKKYAPETNWVVTDLPMYAFRARLPVPPNLAVFSVKRFETGNLSEAEMIATIQKYHPEQILLGRYTYPNVENFLKGRYYLIHAKEPMKLYIRNDLAGVDSVDPEFNRAGPGE